MVSSPVLLKKNSVCSHNTDSAEVGDRTALEKIANSVCGPFDLIYLHNSSFCIENFKNRNSPKACVDYFENGNTVDLKGGKSQGTSYNLLHDVFLCCKK